MAEAFKKTRKRPPPLNAETVARMFDCQDECRDMRTRMVEAVSVLLLVLSVILSVFMGHGHVQSGGQEGGHLILFR